jgi:NADH-quinone oxidoreductase subunit L
VVTIPLMILAGLSVLGGLLNFPGLLTLEHWLAHTFGEIEGVGFLWPVAGLSLLLAVLGLWLAWTIYRKSPTSQQAPDVLQKALGPLFTAMEHKWWVDELYTAVILNPLKAIAGFLNTTIDQKGIDAAGSGLAKVTTGLGTWLRRLQNGFARTYALWMLLGLVVMLTFLVLK